MAEKLEDFESEVGPMSSEADDLNVLMVTKVSIVISLQGLVKITSFRLKVRQTF